MIARVISLNWNPSSLAVTVKSAGTASTRNGTLNDMVALSFVEAKEWLATAPGTAVPFSKS